MNLSTKKSNEFRKVHFENTLYVLHLFFQSVNLALVQKISQNTPTP